jgi:uncharacterized protein
MSVSFHDHLAVNGPKRILALDGGGIRGALSLGYLHQMETMLKERHPHIEDFRLCDYFDLIGGTSTGAIIAAALAKGMTVAEIKDKYFTLGGRIFSKEHKWWNILQFGKFFKAQFDVKPLEEELQNTFGQIILGSDEIRTGLCIVSKRADTNSVWPLNNHPEDKFYDSPIGKNKDIPLWKALRASAAAPSYFVPVRVDAGGGISGAFVDGGVSMANNPALQLLMMATMRSFPFRWPAGENNLLVVSVGTGMSKLDTLPEEITDNTLLDWAKNLPDMFMQDASWHNQSILQWLSRSPTAQNIDMQLGNMEHDLLTPEPMLSYLRYNCMISKENLDKLDVNGKVFTEKEVKDLGEMSNAGNRFELYDIGLKAAAAEISENHFPAHFNI